MYGNTYYELFILFKKHKHTHELYDLTINYNYKVLYEGIFPKLFSTSLVTHQTNNCYSLQNGLFNNNIILKVTLKKMRKNQQECDVTGVISDKNRVIQVTDNNLRVFFWLSVVLDYTYILQCFFANDTILTIV